MKGKKEGVGWIPGVLLGGLALGGGLLWLLTRKPSEATSEVAVKPLQAKPWTEADIEAAARMLASENPRGSRALHIEQVWTQLRACKAGQSLYDRITGGSGWGPQGELRPVATTEPATPALRQLAGEVLGGMHPSGLLGARRFFEPAVQDRAFALGEAARKKRAAGQPLSKQETRLLGYRRTAEQVRRKWISEGHKFIGLIEGIEFYS